MKASDLLGRPVADTDGSALGIVHDLRVVLPAEPGDPADDGERPTEGLVVPTVIALVVGPDDLRCRLAHSWGYAQRSRNGPAPLRALLAGQGARTQEIPVRDVVWGSPGILRVRKVPG